MYLHVTANDCNLNHDPENDAGYLRVLFMADLCKMLTFKEKQKQKFDHGKAILNYGDIKIPVLA